MSSTNQSPQFKKAQEKYLNARNEEERIESLQEMIRECPKHKSSEKMLANLKTRLKRLLEKQEKSKKSGKSTKIGIRKEEMQAVIIGMTNTGKSSLLKLLTNAEPEIADYPFTTKSPIIGMMYYSGVNIQLIEIPAFKSEYYDRGLANTADTIIILVDNLEQIKKIEQELDKAKGKRIIVFNKIDKLNPEEIRKITATLQSKKHNFVVISTESGQGIEELKEKTFYSFNRIRIYTKEPGKEKSQRPMILDLDSTVKDVAEKILKGFSSKIKETKIWGPSSKFSGQKIGLQHKLKDLDVVEFKTR